MCSGRLQGGVHVCVCARHVLRSFFKSVVRYRPFSGQINLTDPTEALPATGLGIRFGEAAVRLSQHAVFPSLIGLRRSAHADCVHCEKSEQSNEL